MDIYVLNLICKPTHLSLSKMLLARPPVFASRGPFGIFGVTSQESGPCLQGGDRRCDAICVGVLIRSFKERQVAGSPGSLRWHGMGSSMSGTSGWPAAAWRAQTEGWCERGMVQRVEGFGMDLGFKIAPDPSN